MLRRQLLIWKLNQTKLGVVTNFFSLILKSRDWRKPQRQEKGMVIKLSQTQIQSTAQRGGSLFSAMLGLAKPALGALASTRLSFGAEKVLKKIFGKGLGRRKLSFINLSSEWLLLRKRRQNNILLEKVGERRRRTIRRFPWHVGVYRSTFGPWFGQKNNWKRYANTTTTTTTNKTITTYTAS